MKFLLLSGLVWILILNGCDIIDQHEGKPTFTSVFEINSVNTNGTEHKILAEGWNFKIDGLRHKIIYESGFNLHIMNLDGGTIKQITNFKDRQGIFDYEISSGAGKIVIALYENENVDLFLSNMDGSNLTQLTGGSEADLDPMFSPSADKIVFRRDWSICIINSDGSGFKYLSQHPDSV